ncbi:MAG TPA: hypothetical protein VGS12_12775 [Caulobacteraceae bacterium]|nr:hypothetical protein [Caulobacteraceae bacterium]
MSEVDRLARRSAYIDAIRGRSRRAQVVGYVFCLVGVLMLLAGRFEAGAPEILVWLGLAVVAAGWALLIWSVVDRLRFMRRNRFEAE